MEADAMAELGPLYSSRVTESCASVDEYCFLCASVDDGADGEAASIRTFVAELVRQHKEINHIVVSVDDIYRNEVCGETPWSTDSIKRHLLFSTEFVGLFHGVVDQASFVPFPSDTPGIVRPPPKKNAMRPAAVHGVIFC